LHGVAPGYCWSAEGAIHLEGALCGTQYPSAIWLTTMASGPVKVVSALWIRV